MHDACMTQTQQINRLPASQQPNMNERVSLIACIPEMQVLHGPRGHQRLLWVVQHIGLGVHTSLVVGHIHAHGLLAHGRLVGVPGGLVVVRERDDGGAHPKDHGGVDLTVGEVGVTRCLGVVPGIAQVCNVHGYHGRLLFFSVQIPAIESRGVVG